MPNTTNLRYRGSIKHKRWRPGGGYGTLCPDWTHSAPAQGFAGDSHAHPWADTEAHAMWRKACLTRTGAATPPAEELPSPR